MFHMKPIIAALLLTGCVTSGVNVNGLAACRAYDGTKRALAGLINQDQLSAAQVDRVASIHDALGDTCLNEPPTSDGALAALEDALYELTLIEGGVQ